MLLRGMLPSCAPASSKPHLPESPSAGTAGLTFHTQTPSRKRLPRTAAALLSTGKLSRPGGRRMPKVQTGEKSGESGPPRTMQASKPSNSGNCMTCGLPVSFSWARQVGDYRSRWRVRREECQEHVELERVASNPMHCRCRSRSRHTAFGGTLARSPRGSLRPAKPIGAQLRRAVWRR